MGNYIVNYGTPISQDLKTSIRDNISPAMVSEDDSTAQYDLDYVLDVIKDDVIEADEKDQKLLKDLSKERVCYIEI